MSEMSSSEAAEQVRILTVDPTPDGRQIGARTRLSELLADRAGDVQSAIGQAVEVLRGSASRAGDEAGWRVASIQATFGVVLTAEAGAIISKASTEASLEVSITVERR
jgi:hypothetical protein